MNIPFRFHSAMAPVCAFSVLAPLFLAGSASGQTSSADLVLLNLHVVTMNDKQSWAQAFAIQGERILWVGSSDEAKKL
jgi:hypothetical protein